MLSLYDDLKDDKVVLSKEQRDFCQRLILLLESDAHVEISESGSGPSLNLSQGSHFWRSWPAPHSSNLAINCWPSLFRSASCRLALVFRRRLPTSHPDNAWITVSPFPAFWSSSQSGVEWLIFTREGSR